MVFRSLRPLRNSVVMQASLQLSVNLEAVCVAEVGYQKLEQKLRNLLFLCAFNACKHNKACRELYERIVNKGKSKKLALLAVSNKLLKHSFAIAKSGNPYDPTHVSVLKVK